MPCIEVARGTNGLRESRPMDQESFSTSLSGAILSPIHLGLGFDPSGGPKCPKDASGRGASFARLSLHRFPPTSSWLED